MTGFDGTCRTPYKNLRDWLNSTPDEIFDLKRQEAELLFRRIGITFAVYGEGGDPERLIPFDIIPRVLDSKEWSFLSRGLEQRVKALNAFIADVYHARDIVRAGIVPESLILLNESFQPEMLDFDVPKGVYTHIAGIDMTSAVKTRFPEDRRNANPIKAANCSSGGARSA